MTPHQMTTSKRYFSCEGHDEVGEVVQAQIAQRQSLPDVGLTCGVPDANMAGTYMFASVWQTRVGAVG